LGTNEIEYPIRFVRLMREIQSNSLKHPHIVEIRESFVTPNGDYVTINELAKENLAKYR